jgi:hypothetical protein
MSDILELVEQKLATCPKSDTPPTVGHRPPFSGDLTVIGHCVGEAYARITAKDFKSESLHTHLAQAYGEAAVLGLEDGPQPVGAGGLPGWLSLIIQLIALVGQNQ